MTSRHIRIALLASSLLLAIGRTVGATPTPAPLPEYEAQDGYRMFGPASVSALKGNRLALHDCFMAAYLRVSSPMQGGEDCEAISSGLSELLFRGKDRGFAEALGVERPEVIAAVKYWIGKTPGFYLGKGFKYFKLKDYPKTAKVLDSAPETDFPIVGESPRHAALLKQISP